MNTEGINRFSKEFPYKEPRGFFEESKQRILDASVNKPSGLQPLRQKRLYSLLAAAAAVIAIVVGTRILLNQPETNTSEAILAYLTETFDVFAPDELSFAEIAVQDPELRKEMEDMNDGSQPSTDAVIEYLLQNESLF